MLAARTASADDHEDLAALRARVDALEQKQRELQLSGYAQVDFVPYRQSSQDEVDGSTRQPLNEDRFTLRRARLRVETDRGYISGAMDIDANTVNGPQVRPWTADVTFKYPAAAPAATPRTDTTDLWDKPYLLVSAGLLYTPFGYEATETEIRRPFLERTTMSNALFPQSVDLGVRVLGGFKYVNYALGIMNGDPVGEKGFPGRDPNKSKDLVFRIGTVARPTDCFKIAAGFSGLSGRGFHEGTPTTKDLLVWRDANADGIVEPEEIGVIPGSPSTPSENFNRFALGADLRVSIAIPVIGDLVVRGEIVRAKNLDRAVLVADPVAASRDLRESGFYVGVTQELTRWGIIGVRYDRYDPDSDRQDQQALHLVPVDASYRTWSFMAGARFYKARIVMQYDLRQNSIGRSDSGQPTTLADDSFTIRAEVGF
jgi:hypothetical protein